MPEQNTSDPLGEEQDKREQDDGLSGAVAAVVGRHHRGGGVRGSTLAGHRARSCCSRGPKILPEAWGCIESAVQIHRPRYLQAGPEV